MSKGGAEMKLYAGIDPGVSGGLAVLWPDGRIHSTCKLADRATFLSAMGSPLEMTILIERVWATPQMGVTSAFTFGHNFGWLTGVLDASGREYREITAQGWQREMKLIQSGGKIGRNADKKARNKEMAVSLWPDAKITNATADALLIAEYCRRKHGA
jgi:hypothetical protein